MRLGVLYPGAMGAAIGAALTGAGRQVMWLPRGRSAGSVRRARRAGLIGAPTLTELCAQCEIIFSVCPPHAALDVASEVADRRFAGLYVDANAIAPSTAQRIADSVTAAGASYVDGGIVGGPPRNRGTTRLFLSGPRADEVAEVFAGTALGTVVLSGSLTAASAVKATYAAWTKGSAALLLAVRETARAAGIEADLLAEWERSQPDLPGRLAAAERAATDKGWRWVGEMEQIAATFADLGGPRGFHDAAAQVYRNYPRPD